MKTAKKFSMGMFRNLFCRRSTKDALVKGCILAVDETERVYRNQLDQHVLSGQGLLKARLFTASFLVGSYVYGGHAINEEDAWEVTKACSGVAMEPFAESEFRPTVSREEAEDVAAPLMTRILKAIKQELESGPSTWGSQTRAFAELVDIYHESLAASVGLDNYDQKLREEFGRFAEQAVWSNLRLCTETIDALR